MRPNIEEIRERSDNASLEPWVIEYPQYNPDAPLQIIDAHGETIVSEAFEPEASFITRSRADIPALLTYIDELENMPLVQTAVEHKQEIERLQSEMSSKDIMIKSLLRTIKSHSDENERLNKALKSIRARLGDFQEPWSDREREIDEIARKAIEGASK